MIRIIFFPMFVLIFLPFICVAQNCCVPAVPQQGVMGETVALPHILEVGFHYELLRSAKNYEGSDKICNCADKHVEWHRATITASYGIFSRLSVGLIIPYLWKKESKESYSYNETDTDPIVTRVEKLSNGIGDLTCILRFSLLPRNFVTFRELSLGLGVKVPSGATDRNQHGILLAQGLQPGTGSWDYHGSISFYQGFEFADFILSGTYIMTTEYDGYKFGNQFSYMLSSSIHLKERLDLSVGFSGVMRERDIDGDFEVPNTGRQQIWFTPGVQCQILASKLRLQVFSDIPIYQHFNETQLGSDYNLRLSASYLIPLKKSGEDDS